MVADTNGQNSTFSGNSTVPTNTTILVWGPIPTDAGRSLQADIVACAVITYVIAFSFVLLRFYTRGWLNHVLGPSDWCILPALVSSFSMHSVGRADASYRFALVVSQLVCLNVRFPVQPADVVGN
jgi:hypothetical protein